jgi:hypothetical protein
LEKTQTPAWQVDSPPWQCLCTWCIKSSGVPGYEIHYKNGSSTSFIQCKVMLLQGILQNDFQDCFRQWRHNLTKESISKVTAAASAQVSKYCVHRAFPGIKLSHLVQSMYLGKN